MKHLINPNNERIEIYDPFPGTREYEWDTLFRYCLSKKEVFFARDKILTCLLFEVVTRTRRIIFLEIFEKIQSMYAEIQLF